MFNEFILCQDAIEICEYTKDKKIAKARDVFFHSEVHFLLYTERSHFYRRFALKGIRHLVSRSNMFLWGALLKFQPFPSQIFYQLPHYPHFFSELCNLLRPSYQNPKGGTEGNMSCTVVYGRHDGARLAAAVGTQRAADMVVAEKNVHVFSPGSTAA